MLWGVGTDSTPKCNARNALKDRPSHCRTAFALPKLLIPRSIRTSLNLFGLHWIELLGVELRS